MPTGPQGSTQSGQSASSSQGQHQGQQGTQGRASTAAAGADSGQHSGQQGNDGSSPSGGQQPYGGGQQQSAERGQMGQGGASGHETAQGSPNQGSAGGGNTHAGSDAASGGGGLPLPSASSYEEQIAVLDGQLEGSMGEYDGMILRERRSIHNRAGEMGAEQQVETFDRNVAYYDEGDLGAEGDGEQAGGGGGFDDEEGTPQVAQAGGNPYGSDAGAPGRANDRAYAPPGDIPSGDDDDVVARQIREAALYEDDPELREKLWEEYRKYKEQTR